MDKKGIEHHILSIVPSISLPLPTELVNLGVSLLIQSRSKAATLKKDEEIARGYACANIACERLKQKLDLPPITPHPPLQPRAYKNVYTYLDSVLGPRSTKRVDQPVTPSKPRETPTKATYNKATPTNNTPSKNRTPKAPTLKRNQGNQSKDGLPDWTMPAIRGLCKVLKKPAATSHVFVGVSSILKLVEEQRNSAPKKKRGRKSLNDAHTTNSSGLTIEEHQIPALIAVVAVHAIAALSDKDPTEKENKRQLKLAVKTLVQSIPDDFTVTEEDMASDLDLFLIEAENGWWEMEWFGNLVQQTQVDETDGDVGEENDEDGEEDELHTNKRADSKKRKVGNGVDHPIAPMRALGSMMTEQTNWLSDQKRADYRKWLKSIAPLLEEA